MEPIAELLTSASMEDDAASTPKDVTSSSQGGEKSSSKRQISDGDVEDSAPNEDDDIEKFREGVESPLFSHNTVCRRER